MDTGNYWHVIGSAAVLYAHGLLDQKNLSAATEVVTALDGAYGRTALTDMSAVLLIMTALRCPADRYRTSDGHPDATALTLNGPVDALRVLDATALANRYRGRKGFTAADIAGTEQQIQATNAVRNLVQAALDAAPELDAVTAALRPAADNPRMTSAVIAMATMALQTVSAPSSD